MRKAHFAIHYSSSDANENENVSPAVVHGFSFYTERRRRMFKETVLVRERSRLAEYFG